MILRPLVDSDHQTAAEIWNAACGSDLSISPHFVEFNLRSPLGAVHMGRVAMRDGRPVGFVVARALPNDPATSPRQIGWIEAVAVRPEYGGQGMGSALLDWAEGWLREQSCTAARLGGGLRPFVAGYPLDLAHDAFFRRRGYAEAPDGRVWDVAADLRDYGPKHHPDTRFLRPAKILRDDQVFAEDAETGYLGETGAVDIRPARPGEEDALRQFLQREFPNRWRFEYEELLRQAVRISDFMLLFTARGINGFAHLTFEDSINPLDRVYMHRLPHPWGQLGPLGVSKDVRGSGYGGMLLDAALGHLRDRGVRGCVIDWTHLVDFYAKFGFKPYREYAILVKQNLSYGSFSQPQSN